MTTQSLWREERATVDDCPLTPTQREVIQQVAHGKTRAQISSETGRSVGTIGKQIHDACKRLGVTGSVQAAILCWKRGWIHIPQDGEPALTPSLRLYSLAFDLHIRSRTAEEKMATRRILDRALHPMCAERGVDPAGRPQRDLIELLVQAVRRERRAG